MENPIDLKQDRRQWLKTSATIVGASLLPAPAISAKIPQADAKAASTSAPAADAKAPAHFFTPAQHAMVEELSEAIIPADSHSGGAKAAKVADTIDAYLRQTYQDDEKALWREGLRLVDLMSQHYIGKGIAQASPEERNSMLKVLSDNSRLTELTEVKFFNALKEMVVFCYYTSKIGIHDELGYKGNRILQEYVGCDDQHLANS